MKANVLVWGATGFIGRHLVQDLVKAGARVTVVTRSGGASLPWNLGNSVEVVTQSEALCSSESLAAIVAKSPIIYNLAGASGTVLSNNNPIANLDGNCRIQAWFLKACEIAGTRPHVVFASSRLVYGKPSQIPVAETAPLFPLSVYAAHKLCVENYHRIAANRNLLTYTVCRIANPYGFDPVNFGRGYGFISDLIGAGLRGQALQVFGDGRQVRDYLHMSDLVTALRLCGENISARNQTFNIGSGEGICILNAALAIQALTGAPIVHKPWPDEYVSVESGDYVSDLAHSFKMLQFVPNYQFASGLAEVIGRARSGEANVDSTGSEGTLINNSQFETASGGG